jgi:predicted deacetylase
MSPRSVSPPLDQSTLDQRAPDKPARDTSCCVVLHDVAPSTWAAYRPFLDAIDRIGNIPLTLLVVPAFHHQGSIVDDAQFRRAMDARLARGDELALHGYHHADIGPAPSGLREMFMRRYYTHEGEFYGMDAATARQRIDAGINVFRSCGWSAQGFVAPAWLLSDAAKREVMASGFHYSSDHGHLIRLPQWQRLSAPSLVWSARSSWRRVASRAWNAQQRRRHADASLLRLGLHPVDMQHPSVLRWWLSTIESLLVSRIAVTKSQALDRLQGKLV